ncbi:MAG: DUF6261 family protein [Bacteroidales bacterium]|jgi:hypothetical protein|nr:DUF6261 family protein [Bacteroidales bacterium]
MKVKIERIHYASLRVDEFPSVYGQTLQICRRYNPDGLYLGKSWQELTSFEPDFQALTVYLRKNDKATQLNATDMERDVLINCIVKVVKGFEHVELPEIKLPYDTLTALLEKHRVKTIAADSRAAETERLQRLEKEISGSAGIQSALSSFGLLTMSTRLFEVNREYESLFADYILEKSEEPHIDGLRLRIACAKALVQFFDAVQYCAFAHEELDYTPLVNGLNQLNSYYIQQLKARATRLKNGKKTADEPPIPPMES